MEPAAALLMLASIFGNHPCASTETARLALEQYGEPLYHQIYTRSSINLTPILVMSWQTGTNTVVMFKTKQDHGYGQVCISQYKKAKIHLDK